MRRNTIVAGVVMLLLIAPAVVWGLYKPSRVLMPQWNGVVCPVSRLCVEDTTTLEKASALARQAVADIEQRLGALSYEPRFVFCSSQACFESFGFSKAAAQTVGTLGTVVGPRGWKDYYLRHELIHQWQFDHIGIIATTRAPDWLREGMAYHLSDDPRSELTYPLQTYRARFARWYATIDKAKLVEAIRAVQ